MSNAGKSLVTAGLCRVFNQDGYKVAPFKSQNMALNSFITRTGAEMGRAQVVQAEAANIEPDVAMNPILLKPTSDCGSQVIVNGEPIGTMTAAEYFKMKHTLKPEIMKAFNGLADKKTTSSLSKARAARRKSISKRTTSSIWAWQKWLTHLSCSWRISTAAACSLPFTAR